MNDFRELLHYEVSVNLALVDGLRPGDRAFDIGTNVGNQAALMSRLVGLRGEVLAVEANPKTALTARESLLRMGCSNTLVLNRAVTERTGEAVKLFLGDGPNDSLIPHPWISAESVEVETITLDDVSRFLDIDPVLVKIDIEGAELRALEGAQDLIARCKPTFILEQNAQNTECVTFLRERGYACLDLNSYLPITRPEDYPRYEQNPVRNIVCYPTAQAGEARRSAYEDVTRREVATLCADDFGGGEGPGTSKPLRLEAGRYSIAFDYDCPDDFSVQVGVWCQAATAFLEYYEAPAGWLRYACFDLPFHLDDEAEVQVVMRSRDGSGEVIARGAALVRVEGLPGRRPARTFLL